MQEIISSLQNPKIKQLQKLQEKSSERRKTGLFVIEGERELRLAMAANHPIKTIFHCKDIKNLALEMEDEKKVLHISKEVFSKIAYRENSDGIIAIATANSTSLKDLKISEQAFVIVLEAVEKPGNLGAILRTADAAQADAVLICDPKTDTYNPNVIRSSVGCVFSVPVAVGSKEDVLAWLQERKITPFAAALTAKKLYHQQDFTKASAIVMGTEADGLSSFWLNNAEQIKIPMRGKIDSLNVAACTAILTFEAMRQRNF